MRVNFKTEVRIFSIILLFACIFPFGFNYSSPMNCYPPEYSCDEMIRIGMNPIISILDAGVDGSMIRTSPVLPNIILLLFSTIGIYIFFLVTSKFIIYLNKLKSRF